MTTEKEELVALYADVPRSLKQRIRKRVLNQGDQRRIIIEALQIGLEVLELQDQLAANGYVAPVPEEEQEEPL
jgi:hypothetical protein